MDLVVQRPISLRCFPQMTLSKRSTDKKLWQPECCCCNVKREICICWSHFLSGIEVKSQLQRRRLSTVSSALPETAVSVAVAGTLVGVAATLLVKRSKTSESTQIQFKVCEDCGGSGICSSCNGEGFMLRKRSEESAERARTLAKNMATRFTAGLPKKWSYCTKCSSARSCSTCGGSGKLSC